MNSSLGEVLKAKSSSPSPSRIAWPHFQYLLAAAVGRLTRSPVTYSLLPGCTASRLPPWPCPNTG